MELVAYAASLFRVWCKAQHRDPEDWNDLSPGMRAIWRAVAQEALNLSAHVKESSAMYQRDQAS